MLGEVEGLESKACRCMVILCVRVFGGLGVGFVCGGLVGGGGCSSGFFLFASERRERADLVAQFISISQALHTAMFYYVRNSKSRFRTHTSTPLISLAIMHAFTIS